MPVLFLTEQDVRQLLTMELALTAVEAAFRKLALDEAVNRPRQRCQTDAVMLHVLPAAAKTLNGLGFKAYTSCKHGTQFHVFLYDPRQGHLTAIFEADLLGAVRTGAATGVATNKLARQDATRVGMIGSGKQAKTQLQAVCKVRPITSARIFSRDADKLLAFTTEMSSELGIPVEASQSAEAAVRDAEIVITATTAREPVLFGEWLSPGSHVNLIGSNMLSKAEADVEVFRRAEVITIDSRDQARLECGDFIKAIEAKLFNWGDVPEFAQLLMGHYAGRMNDQQITVFKSLGIGIQDVAVAAKIFELATQQGLGQHLPIG